MNRFIQNLKIIITIFAVSFFTVSLNAQSTMEWRGTINSDIKNADNWDPSGGVDGNYIKIGNVSTYANPVSPNHPIVTGGQDITVSQLEIAGPFHDNEPLLDEEGSPLLDENENPITKDDYYEGGKLTIALDEGVKFSYSTSNGFYMRGTILVQSGIMEFPRTLYLDQFSSSLIIENDGIVNAGRNGYFMIGNDDDHKGNRGGTILVKDNGVLNVAHTGGIGRWTNEETNTVTIQDNGVINLVGDHRNRLTQKQSINLLIGGDDFYPHFWFDVPSNRTTINAVPADKPWVYFADRLTTRSEKLMSSEEGSELALEFSHFTEEGTKFEWKYGTIAGGPYDQTLVENDGENIKPVFNETGNFYLVCEVTFEGDTYTSNEISYQIASDKLIPNHAGKQYLRGAQVGGTIKFTAEGNLTEGSVEWKWSTTPGEGYQSFDSPVKDLEYTPDFAEIGTYYLVLDAEIDGAPQRSVEIEIEKQAHNASSLPLDWTGIVDEDFGNMFNWTPHAYPNRNEIKIFVDAPIWPVFTAGVDTIYAGSEIQSVAAVLDEQGEVTTPAKKAMLIMRATDQDTLEWRGSTYGLHGILRVEGGVFVKNHDLLRMTDSLAEIQVAGEGQVHFGSWNGTFNNLSIGNSDNPSSGGSIYLSDNGIIKFSPAPIHRLTTNPEADFAKIYIKDNAKMLFWGDFYANIATYNNNNRLVLEEDYTLSVQYDNITDYTYVTARNLSDFAILNTEAQYISVNQASELLTLENVGELSDFTWQFGQGALGPWQDFGITGDQAVVEFDVPGTYYVSVVSGDGTRSATVVKFVVVDFKVIVDEDDGDYTLFVELPDESINQGWQVKTPGSDEYEYWTFGENFLLYMVEEWHFIEDGDGEYTFSFKVIIKDENDADIEIYATPVTLMVQDGVISVKVGIDSVEEIAAGAYPNPSNGEFTLNVNADNYMVEIIDLSGNLISRNQMSSRSSIITINNSGVYILRVITNDNITTKRVIIK